MIHETHGILWHPACRWCRGVALELDSKHLHLVAAIVGIWLATGVAGAQMFEVMHPSTRGQMSVFSSRPSASDDGPAPMDGPGPAVATSRRPGPYTVQ